MELEFSMIWMVTGTRMKEEGTIRRCQVNGRVKAMKRDLKYVK